MKRSPALLLALSSVLVNAQVRIDAPLHFSGEAAAPEAIGLGRPHTGDAAITVEGSIATGGYTWCAAILSGDTIVLTASPPLTAYANGTLLRFQSTTTIAGQRFIKADGLPALPVTRTDGLRITRGEILTGFVTEVMHVDGRFLALNASARGCSPNTTLVHANLCIDTAPTANFLFKDAVDRCVDRGGKLCAWDEFIAACSLQGGQLQGLFTNWEWMDESSNHSHGADQVGRFTCLSQRQVSAIPTVTASVRCCYRPR